MAYSELGSIDRTRYTDLSDEGLEGPFLFPTGKILYYDPRAGKYWDRDSDFYISNKEMMLHYGFLKELN